MEGERGWETKNTGKGETDRNRNRKREWWPGLCWYFGMLCCLTCRGLFLRLHSARSHTVLILIYDSWPTNPNRRTLSAFPNLHSIAVSSKPPVTFHVNSNLLKILRRRWRFLFLVAAMYVEAWQVRATAILVTAMVLVFGYYSPNKACLSPVNLCTCNVNKKEISLKQH